MESAAATELGRTLLFAVESGIMVTQTLVPLKVSSYARIPATLQRFRPPPLSPHRYHLSQVSMFVKMIPLFRTIKVKLELVIGLGPRENVIFTVTTVQSPAVLVLLGPQAKLQL